MALPETFEKLSAFLATSELLEADERGMFLRLVKRLTSEDPLDDQLKGWTSLATDAAWFKARAYEIAQRETEAKTNHQKKLFGGVEDKNTPKWQVEARLEADPVWVNLCRRVHVASQLQIVADKICEIAMASLRGLEAQGNNARFYGRVDGV